MATTNNDEVALIVVTLLFAGMVLVGSGNKSTVDKKTPAKNIGEESVQTQTSGHSWQQINDIKRHAMNHLNEADRILN